MGGLGDSRLVRSLLWLARWRYLILAALGAYWCAFWLGVGSGDWYYFFLGSDLLVGHHAPGTPPGGLHLYAGHPELQIGPLSFLETWLFRLSGIGDGHLPAQIFMAAMGLPVLFLLERAAVAARGLERVSDEPLLPLATLAGGLLFMRMWIGLTVISTHLDDATILIAAAVAIWAIPRKRWGPIGLAAGLAVAAKPWGVLLLPLLFALPLRGAARALALAGGIGAVAWLPFVLGDAHTLSAAGSFAINNDPESALRVLGVHAAKTPHWLRPVQLGLGMGLGAAAVARGRWAGVLLIGIAARIALDPGVFGYYTTGLLLAALAWDLVGLRRPLPVWTLVCYFGLEGLGSIVTDPHGRGVGRLVVAVAALVGVLLAPRLARTEPQSTQRRLPQPALAAEP